MSLSAIRTESSEEVKAILDNAAVTIKSLSETYTATHADISSTEAAFVTALAGNVEVANDDVDGLYKTVREALCGVIGNISCLERFIGLRIPQMEDGNNFGVTVQMMVSKLLKEKREQFEKSLSETSKYYSSRADAIDKFSHLPKTSKSESKTESYSNSTGGKDGDSNTKSESGSTETKTTVGQETVNTHRVKALAALDAQMYFELKFVLKAMLDDYLIILDNFEKNMDKLEHPRGKAYGGYGSGGSSMVY